MIEALMHPSQNRKRMTGPRLTGPRIDPAAPDRDTRIGWEARRDYRKDQTAERREIPAE